MKTEKMESGKYCINCDQIWILETNFCDLGYLWLLIIFFHFTFLCMLFYLHTCICTIHNKHHAVLMEARSYHIPWASHRWLWATTWGLGIKQGSSGRADSSLNCWAPIQPLWYWFLGILIVQNTGFPKKLPYWYSKGLCQLSLPQAMEECSLYSTSSPA